MYIMNLKVKIDHLFNCNYYVGNKDKIIDQINK